MNLNVSGTARLDELFDHTAIVPRRVLWYFPAQAKRPFIIPIPYSPYTLVRSFLGD